MDQIAVKFCHHWFWGRFPAVREYGEERGAHNAEVCLPLHHCTCSQEAGSHRGRVGHHLSCALLLMPISDASILTYWRRMPYHMLHTICNVHCNLQYGDAPESWADNACAKLLTSACMLYHIILCL